MAVIRLKAFNGEKPGVSRHLLETHDAQLATNCDLRSGSARALPLYVHDGDLAIAGGVKTIHRYKGTGGAFYFLQWGSHVSVAYPKIALNEKNIACFTGDGLPRATDSAQVDAGGDNEYPEASYLLKVPAPAAKPTVTLGGGGSGTARDVAYVYTYIRKWLALNGSTEAKVDESKPSPVSDTLSALPGQTITVGGFTAPPANSNITHIRIYRAVTGSAATEFQFVTEIATATSSHADSATDSALGETIPSEDWDVPPDDMHSITMHPNGCMIGLSGRTVLISAPYQFHAYPQRYRHELTHEGVAIGLIGTTVVVATKGEPYVIEGADPEGMFPIPLGVIQPCLSARGLVSGDRGVYYPCPDGLMWIGAGRQHDVMTDGIMRADDWKSLFPDTMHAVLSESRYIAFYTSGTEHGVMVGGGIVLDVAQRPTGMTRVGFYAHAAHLDAASKQVYLCMPRAGYNSIFRWMGGGPYPRHLNYTWRSKEFRSNNPVNLAAARVDADFSALLSADEIAAREAGRLAVIAANQAIIDAGDPLYGALNETAINEYAISADILTGVDEAFEASDGVLFRLFADGREVFGGTIVNNNPFRLPGGHVAHRFVCEIGASIPALEVVMGESVEELYQ